MARQAVSDMLLGLLERDPRFNDLPGGVCMTWLRLLRMMQALGQNALCYGGEIPDDNSVAHSVSLSGAEFGTHLDPLIRRGLLHRRADGALESPHLKPTSTKHAIAARNNGLKGGRKPAAAAVVTESNVVQGDFSGRDAVQAEPMGSASLARAKLSLEREAKLSSDAPTESSVPEDWARVGQAAFEAAQLDPARSTATFGVVRQWMARGASETLILDTITRVRGRMGQAPRHLGYFEPAIVEALEAGRRMGPPTPTDPIYAAAITAYNRDWEAWRDAGMCGAPPVLPAKAAVA